MCPRRRHRARGALKKRQGKFSCLQPVEKAQIVEMSSVTEDGLGATDRERGGSFARRIFACTRGIAVGAQGALKNGMQKFSCLQRIEKAQNVKIFSAAEDGLGSNQPDGGGSPIVAVFPSAAERRLLRPQSR